MCVCAEEEGEVRGRDEFEALEEVEIRSSLWKQRWPLTHIGRRRLSEGAEGLDGAAPQGKGKQLLLRRF